MTRYGIRLPDDMAAHVSDWMLESMAGTVVDLSLFGVAVGEATITSIRRYTDELMGPGIWVEMEAKVTEAEEATADTGARYSTPGGPPPASGAWTLRGTQLASGWTMTVRTDRQERAMPAHVIELGATVRDRVSGWEGVATSRYEYLNACERYEVSGADKDGKPEAFVFDSVQLEVLKAPDPALVRQPVRVEPRTGGPRDSAPVPR